VCAKFGSTAWNDVYGSLTSVPRWRP
jgi:hypothetical protein